MIHVQSNGTRKVPAGVPPLEEKRGDAEREEIPVGLQQGRFTHYIEEKIGPGPPRVGPVLVLRAPGTCFLCNLRLKFLNQSRVSETGDSGKATPKKEARPPGHVHGMAPW